MIKATNPIIRFFSKKKEPYFFLLHKILGFKPKNIEIYKQAFVHRSALGNGDKTLKSNERLEYLGDAMLSAAMADILYTKFPDADEGFLTQKRAILVSVKIRMCQATPWKPLSERYMRIKVTKDVKCS